MRRLDFPAGSTIRLTATASSEVGVHRWDVRIFTADGPTANPAPRLAYGSQIGGRDCEQRIDIPAQDADCRVEVSSGRHATAGWQDDRCSIHEDTPSRLLMGFSDPSSPESRNNEVLLSFDFAASDARL